MSSSALSRSSISKQRGAEMSSRLMPPKLGRQPGDGLDDLLDVGGVQADRDGVDAAELLEQHGLALHHRHRGGRADVAEAEHGGAVGDDGDGVRHPGVVLGHRRVGGDRLAHPGHARRVGQREVVAAVERRPSSGPPSCRRRAGRRPGRRRTGGTRCHGISWPCHQTFQRGTCGGERPSSTRRGGARNSSGLGGSPQRSVWHSGHSRRGRGQTRATATAITSASGTGPRCRESTPSSGLSLSSHQAGDPSRVVRRSVARLTATVPSASRATTTSPGPDGAAGRTRAAGRRRRSVGVIDAPRHPGEAPAARTRVHRWVTRLVQAPARGVVSQSNRPRTTRRREDPHVRATVRPHPRGLRPLRPALRRLRPRPGPHRGRVDQGHHRQGRRQRRPRLPHPRAS